MPSPTQPTTAMKSCAGLQHGHKRFFSYFAALCTRQTTYKQQSACVPEKTVRHRSFRAVCGHNLQ